MSAGDDSQVGGVIGSAERTPNQTRPADLGGRRSGLEALLEGVEVVEEIVDGDAAVGVEVGIEAA